MRCVWPRIAAVSGTWPRGEMNGICGVDEGKVEVGRGVKKRKEEGCMGLRG